MQKKGRISKPREGILSIFRPPQQPAVITALDHVAIAVPDLERAVRRLVEDFGLAYSGKEEVEAAMTTTAFFPLPPTSIELIYPLQGQGPVQKFLDKQGRGGLHHISFRSDDIEADVVRLRGKGYEFLSEKPGPGAHGSRVIFIHPKCCDGVLVEICQAAESS